MTSKTVGMTQTRTAGEPAEQVSSGGDFWREKALHDMTPEEWESLCDGCGRCCLVKLEDEDTGEMHFTDVACHLLDHDGKGCRSYETRQKIVHDCVVLNPDNVASLKFMPATCAYRLLAEGRELYWWHPLVSGDRETMHLAGMSIRGRVVSEEKVDDADLENRIVDWPDANSPAPPPDDKVA